MDPIENIGHREDEEQPPDVVVVPVPVLPDLRRLVGPSQNCHHLPIRSRRGENTVNNAAQVKSRKHLYGSVVCADLQATQHEDEDPQALVSRYVGADPVLQYQTGYDPDQSDHIGGGLDGGVSVEPERVHVPKVSSHHRPDDHQDPPAHHVQKPVALPQPRVRGSS